MSKETDMPGDAKVLAARRLRLRNMALLGALLGFVLIVYLITILKMKM